LRREAPVDVVVAEKTFKQAKVGYSARS
jgi:hypothetical protein